MKHETRSVRRHNASKEDDAEIITSPVTNKIKRWEHSSRNHETSAPKSRHSSGIKPVYKKEQILYAQSRSDDTAEIDKNAFLGTGGLDSMDSRDDIVPSNTSTKRYQVKYSSNDKQQSVLGTKKGSKEAKAKVFGSRTGGLTGQEREYDDPRYGTVVGSRSKETVDTDVSTHDSMSYGLKSIQSSTSEDILLDLKRTESSAGETIDYEWMRSEAQRIQELNAIKVPQEIVGQYEQSHLVRKKPLVDEEKTEKKKMFGRIRKLVGAGMAKTYKNPSLVEGKTKRTLKKPPTTRKNSKTAKNDEVQAAATSSNKKATASHKQTTKVSLNDDLQAAFEKRRKAANDELQAALEKRRRKVASQNRATIPEVTKIPSKESLSEENHEIHETNVTPPEPSLAKNTHDQESKPAVREEGTKTEVVEMIIPQKSIVDEAISEEDGLESDLFAESGSDLAVDKNESTGHPITDWLVNKVDALANIGYSKSCFGSFMDLEGEETIISRLEAVTMILNDDTRRFAKRKIPKMKLTKRVLTKEEVKAHIAEERRRRQLQDNPNLGDAINSISQSLSDSSMSIKEVKSLTLDVVTTPRQRLGANMTQAETVAQTKSTEKPSAIVKRQPALSKWRSAPSASPKRQLEPETNSREKRDPPALMAPRTAAA
jgi:hypothetical protein